MTDIADTKSLSTLSHTSFYDQSTVLYVYLEAALWQVDLLACQYLVALIPTNHKNMVPVYLDNPSNS
jgi:hypothetical protein